jgi:hypothetical protein
MIYNKTHDQYRLGLGLYFQLKFGHPENPTGWTCISNIPGMNYKRLEAATKQEAGHEVMEVLETEINLVHIDPIVFNHIIK